MTLKKILGVFIMAFLTVAIYLYFKAGAFKAATVTPTPVPKYQFFYKENIGPYHKVIEPLIEVEEKFEELGIPCNKTFGLYLSDPERVNHDKLKSRVGCAFTPEESPQIFSLPEGIKEGFYELPISSEEELKLVECFKGEFSGSPSLTAMKVYPLIKEEAKNKGIQLFQPTLEIYENSVKEDPSTLKTTVIKCGL